MALLGPLLVFVAAMLWATDAPFRSELTQGLSSSFIVLAEHGVNLLFAIPVRCLRREIPFAAAAEVVSLFNNRRWPCDGEFWLVEPGGEFAAIEEADE